MTVPNQADSSTVTVSASLMLHLLQALTRCLCGTPSPFLVGGYHALGCEVNAWLGAEHHPELIAAAKGEAS